MDYKGPDNIYWLFSSSAQAIAAFIGFLTAGFYFVLDKMDYHVMKDSSLEEINNEIKRMHFNKVKILSLLTGASIILSLLLVFTNGYDYRFKNGSVLIVSLLNLFTISWAIYFIISIINPDNINKAANKLIKENKYLPGIHNIGDTVEIGLFLEKFIEFEKLIRKIDKTLDISYNIRDKYGENPPLNELIKWLNQRNIINDIEYKYIQEIKKVRNLAIHGNIDVVDKKILEILSKLISKINDRFLFNE